MIPFRITTPLKLASALFGAVAALVIFSGLVTAQQPTPSDDEVNALAREMYCPVCENIPLDACPTQACAQWRELIREKLALGWTHDQIKEYFADQYGDRVLAEPPLRGLNWLVYVLPPSFILIGVFILVRVFRASRAMSIAAPADMNRDDVNPVNDPYLSRVEEELDRRNRSL
jgi:cytochrome c-type biogenesis protein CcmH